MPRVARVFQGGLCGAAAPAAPGAWGVVILGRRPSPQPVRVQGAVGALGGWRAIPRRRSGSQRALPGQGGGTAGVPRPPVAWSQCPAVVLREGRRAAFRWPMAAGWAARRPFGRRPRRACGPCAAVVTGRRRGPDSLPFAAAPSLSFRFVARGGAQRRLCLKGVDGAWPPRSGRPGAVGWSDGGAVIPCGVARS